MNKTVNDNLIKNSAVIAISNKISLLQRKLFNFLIANAYPLLAKEDTYNIDISQIKIQLWFNSKNINYLKESLKLLISTIVEFNLLWKDKEVWSATTLLSSVEFKNWKCSYSFSPVLRKKLHQPNIYAKMKLSLMKLFSSKYSLCLYEIFLDYQNIGQTPIIPIDNFRKLMWIQENQYKEFKRLSIRVIKPALAEISTIWGYNIEVKYTRSNKKVVALKFYFQVIKKSKGIIHNDKIILNSDLQIRLITEFWLSLRQAQKVIQIYPVEYITESIEIVKHKITQKIVKNIPAYTITVLKNDYEPLQHTKKQPLLWCSQKGWWKKMTFKAWMENVKSHVGDSVSCDTGSYNLRQNQEKAIKYFESLSWKEKRAVVKKFEDEKITNNVLKTIYKKEWLEGRVFKLIFTNYLSIYIK